MAQFTTAKILTDGSDPPNPIPQYLDITDTTDSPQGTFKPLTKVQDTQLTGSNIPDDQPIPTKPGIPSDSWTTHNQLSIAASGSGSYVKLTTAGYRKGMLVVYSTLGYNCHARLIAYSRAGTAYNAEIGTTSSGKTGYMVFDLNGLDSIGVNVFNDDGTNTNTITCDIWVQG